MTDMAHLTQLLQEAAHREHFTLPALRDWLRDRREETRRRRRTQPPPRQRRRRGADHDGVGQQGSAVPDRLPAVRVQPQRAGAATRSLFHDNGIRCLHIGGSESPDFREVERLGRAESASDDSRLMYVAMTRAQSQVVAWWAPSKDEPNGGLSRLLRGPPARRAAGAATSASPRRSPTTRRVARFAQWEDGRRPGRRGVGDRRRPRRRRRGRCRRTCPPGTSTAASTRRWRRTSYSGLVRAAQERVRGEQRAGGRRTRRRGRRHPTGDAG